MNTHGAAAKAYKFIIFDVQQDEFRPKMSLLCGLYDLGDVDTGNEEFQVLHHW